MSPDFEETRFLGSLGTQGLSLRNHGLRSGNKELELRLSARIKTEAQKSEPGYLIRAGQVTG